MEHSEAERHVGAVAVFRKRRRPMYSVVLSPSLPKALSAREIFFRRDTVNVPCTTVTYLLTS